MKGIIIITLAWIGSGGVGLSLVWIEHRDDHDHRQDVVGILRRQVGDPENPGRIAHLDGTQQHPVERDETGICTTIGRQPPSGLIFSVLYSSIISWFSFWRSSP
jgi:hypothetical protein